MSKRPTPTQKRILEGNPAHRPLPANEPEMPAATPGFDTVPDVLAKDELARTEWERLAPMLRKARVVTEAERSLLTALCQQWATYQNALAKVTLSGMVVTSPSGYPMPNPYIGIANKALQHCQKMWIELGITPAARTKVQPVYGDGPAGEDDMSEFDEEPAAGSKPN